MYYYTVEDGNDCCIEMVENKDFAIKLCNEIDRAKEVFKFKKIDEDKHECIECVYKKLRA